MDPEKLDAWLGQMSELSFGELKLVQRTLNMQMELCRLRESQDVTGEFELMKEIKHLLNTKGPDMASRDATLLACRHVQLSGSEVFNARQVNAILQECDCKPSNTSNVMESLQQRQMIDVKGSEELGKHKLFSLTQTGYHHSVMLLEAARKPNPHRAESL